MILNKHFLLTLSYFTMDIFFTKGSGAPLTDNEKLIIINIYNYFSGTNFKKKDYQKVTLRKH